MTDKPEKRPSYKFDIRCDELPEDIRESILYHVNQIRKRLGKTTGNLVFKFKGVDHYGNDYSENFSGKVKVISDENLIKFKIKNPRHTHVRSAYTSELLRVLRLATGGSIDIELKRKRRNKIPRK